MESSEPDSPNHSKLGNSTPVSPVGSSKFKALEAKRSEDGAYQDTVVPQKYNGMTAKLNSSMLDKITSMKADDFSANLACTMPGKSPEGFKKNYSVQEQGRIRNAELNPELLKKTEGIVQSFKKTRENESTVSTQPVQVKGPNKGIAM